MSVLAHPGFTRARLLTGVGLAVLTALLARLALLDYAPASSLFHPHGYCYLWQPSLVAVHVVSDGLIGVSYIAISATLIYLVWRARQLLPFSWIFVAFGAFIVACGLTHLVEIWTLWVPVFWLSGDVKIVTALASVATAVVLPPLIPEVLRVIHDARVSDERRVALEAAHHELEHRVAERTAQLQAALERAEEAMRAKEVFLSTVSHELRTPLNAILGWSRMLNAPGSDEQFIKRGLAVIDRNATVQAQLVEDLLDISRLDAGRLQLQMQPVDLVQVVSDAVEVIRPAAAAKEVALVIAETRAHLALVGDRRRLQQIVWNLLSNAVKFTAARGRVLVSVGVEAGRASIEVHDTGIGIDPAFLPHLFERFTQADASPTRAHQGLGLGLAIVRQMVELHGGVVSAFSAGPGAGATFRVELPVQPGAGASIALESPRAALLDLDLSGIRVLVVDDDEDARETLGVMLARSGASVITTATADAAFEALRGHRFDVLLSDLGMPARDGYDLIRQIRRTQDDRIRGTPAIAVSAYARDEDRERAIAAGYHLHMAKPVTPEELVSAVSALISR